MVNAHGNDWLSVSYWFRGSHWFDAVEQQSNEFLSALPPQLGSLWGPVSDLAIVGSAAGVFRCVKCPLTHCSLLLGLPSEYQAHSVLESTPTLGQQSLRYTQTHVKSLKGNAPQIHTHGRILSWVPPPYTDWSSALAMHTVQSLIMILIMHPAD